MFQKPRDVKQIATRTTNFDRIEISDFRGGLNTYDPKASLSDNEFSTLVNFTVGDRGSLMTRPPYRPLLSVDGNANDTRIRFDKAGGATPDILYPEVIRHYVFDLENNISDSDKTFFAVVKYNDTTDKIGVIAYDSASSRWILIFSTPYPATEDIKLDVFRVNEATDVLIFPDGTNPHRWSGDITSLLSERSEPLGLAKPDVGSGKDFSVAFARSAFNSSDDQGIDLSNNPAVNYKFAYFYNDTGSTKFGLSQACAFQSYSGYADGTTSDKITITLTMDATYPGDIDWIYVYRAPSGNSQGPYKKVGIIDASGWSSGDLVFNDSMPWLYEGAEEEPTYSNPGELGNELVIINPKVIGGRCYGFDSKIKNKLMYSVDGYADVWRPLEYHYLDTDGAGIIDFNRNIYAATKTGWYQIDASNPANRAVKISEVGCVSGDSIQEVGRGIMWLGHDNVYFADFVQAYQSDGDFPKDVGRKLKDNWLGREKGTAVSSTYADDKYYISIKRDRAAQRNMFVYDTRYNWWVEHDIKRDGITSIDDMIFTLGTYKDGANNVSYIYEHDYVSDVSVITSEDSYLGRDFKDYEYVDGSGPAGGRNISVTLKSKVIHFGLETGKFIVSSCSLVSESSFLNANITVECSGFSRSRLFTDEANSNVLDENVLLWDSGHWAADEWTSGEAIVKSETENGIRFDPDGNNYILVGDSILAGDNTTTPSEDSVNWAFHSVASTWGGYDPNYSNQHKKFKRGLKSDQCQITLASFDARDLNVIAFVIYYKRLPNPA